MSLEVTEFYDDESGRNYLLLYDRELSHDEARQAVGEFKIDYEYKTPKGSVFIIGIDSGWRPKAGA